DCHRHRAHPASAAAAGIEAQSVPGQCPARAAQAARERRGQRPAGVPGRLRDRPLEPGAQDRPPRPEPAPRHRGRADVRAVARRPPPVGGLYVPGGYHTRASPEGWLVPVPRAGFPARVASVWVKELRAEYTPAAPLLPIGEITHDRLSVEIMRGCTRGCRFCQAGMINRPVREKPAQQVVEEVLRGLEATGLEEVSLVSLSSTDHTQIVEQVAALAGELCPSRVQISLPSTRPDNVPAEVARRIAAQKKGSITLAPEAGSQRMRDVI